MGIRLARLTVHLQGAAGLAQGRGLGQCSLGQDRCQDPAGAGLIQAGDEPAASAGTVTEPPGEMVGCAD